MQEISHQEKMNSYDLVQDQLVSHLDVQDFIEDREITEEDLPILLNLARCRKRLYIDFHNFFNLHKERSEAMLQIEINNCDPEDQEKIRFLTNLKILLEKYHYGVCWNWIRIMERLL